MVGVTITPRSACGMQQLAEPVAPQPQEMNLVERLQSTIKELNECQSDADIEALSMRVQMIMSEVPGMEGVIDRISLLKAMEQAELVLQTEGQHTKSKRMKKMRMLLESLPNKSPKKQRKVLRELLVLTGKNVGVNIGKRGFCGYSIFCNAVCITSSVLVLSGAAVAIGMLAGGLDAAEALEEGGSPDQPEGGSEVLAVEEKGLKGSADMERALADFKRDFKQALEEEFGSSKISAGAESANLAGSDNTDLSGLTLAERQHAYAMASEKLQAIFGEGGNSLSPQEILQSTLWGDVENLIHEESFEIDMLVVANAFAFELNALFEETSNFDSTRELLLFRALSRLHSSVIGDNLIAYFGHTSPELGFNNGWEDVIYSTLNELSDEGVTKQDFSTMFLVESFRAVPNVAYDHYNDLVENGSDTDNVVKNIVALLGDEQDNSSLENSHLEHFAELARSGKASHREEVALVIEAVESYIFKEYLMFDEDGYRNFLQESPEDKLMFVLNLLG